MEKTTKWDSKKISEFLLNYALYIILGLMLIVIICVNPKFLSVSNFTKILTQASTRIILALGVAGMIVLAGTDLSVGRIVGCSAAVTASLVQATTYGSRMYQFEKDLPLIVPLLASIAVAMILDRKSVV